MYIFERWETWVIIYLISACIFARSFKKSNRNMKDANALTILLEIFTALFALLFIPFFKITFPSDINIYFTLVIVFIIYAITDRLNTESRYGLEPSTFSMLKQLSTVFMLIFGFMILKETFSLTKLFGGILIISANLLLTFEKGKIKLNKYFIMSVISNLLFAIAMLINVDISDNFNLAMYTIMTVFIPSLIIMLFTKTNIKKLQTEFNRYDKPIFLLSAFMWCVMLLSSVKAYQLGDVTIVAPLFALTSIINVIIEFIIDRNTKELIPKLIAAIGLIIGVILIKM